MENIHPSRMRLGAIYGYAGALLNVVAFVWYCAIMFGDGLTTNPITWWLWAGETLTGLCIYADRTQDRPKWLLEATAMVGVTIVSGYLLLQLLSGAEGVVLQTVETVDYWIAAATTLTLVFWIVTRKHLGPSVSLWVFQGVILAAALPLIRATWENPSAEPFWPWAVWTAGFVSLSLCTWYRWDGRDVFIYALNNTATHTAITLAIVIGASW